MYRFTAPALFATVIIMSFLITNGVDAKTSDDKLNEKIPGDKLLNRHEDWKLKYDDSKKYEEEDKAIHAYVDDNHPDNEWNKITKKNQIKIYNFDTRADQKDAGLHALLFHVKYQKESDTYNPTVAERRFHDWATEEIKSPVMPTNVTSNMIQAIIKTYNENANYGHVPIKLFDSDVDFWIKVAADKMCELDNTCDLNGAIFDPDSPDCTFVQCADATTWSTHHRLYVFVEPYSCAGTSNCISVNRTSGSGELEISALDPTGNAHSTTRKIKYYAIDHSYVDTYRVSHELIVTLNLGENSFTIGPRTGTDSVIIYGDKTFKPDTCNDNRVEPNCGTYSIRGVASDATFET